MVRLRIVSVGPVALSGGARAPFLEVCFLNLTSKFFCNMELVCERDCVERLYNINHYGLATSH